MNQSASKNSDQKKKAIISFVNDSSRSAKRPKKIGPLLSMSNEYEGERSESPKFF